MGIWPSTDPPVANFDDPAVVKIVQLDQTCRQQQVNDGCFPTLAAVPDQAITLTLPVFLRANQLSIVVVGESKSGAILATCSGAISTQCPASILRRHSNVSLFLDHAAARLLPATEA